MSIPIRIRLTIWTVLLLALTLGVFAAGVYEFLERQGRNSVNNVLRERAATFNHAYGSELSEEPSEQAVVEAARNFVYRDGDTLVYAPPLRLVTRSSARLLRADPLSIPSIRQAINGAFRGETKIVRAEPGIRAIVAPVGRRFAFVATQSLAAEQETLRRARVAFALAIPAALLIAAIGGYTLVRRSLAPVGKIAETASRIEAENLSTRIAVTHPDDELGRLGVVLNALFDRLERSFAQQRQLIADTSHELRTPVTIIRSEAEVALSRERDAAEYRRALEIVRSEAAYLTQLIESVLILARADAKQIHIEMKPLSLRQVIEESVRSAETLARARGVHLTTESNGPMPMRGDPELMRRLLLNLLDNAIKFSDAGGQVAIEAQRAGTNYVIAVSDHGRGIAVSDQPKIFDRFFRGDRARESDGTGLGLPIVKWIAEAHGGQARLVRSGQAGSLFEVTLPGDDVRDALVS